MITAEEIRRIANLARIGITERELEKLGEDLSSVLEFVSKLQKADTKEVEPTTQICGVENAMRRDLILGEIEGTDAVLKSEETAKKLAEMAPEKEGGYIKVKSVL